jgi:hydrogenase nickel incorporation protein HypB
VCEECGCGILGKVTIDGQPMAGSAPTAGGHDHTHGHDHPHTHEHEHPHAEPHDPPHTHPHDHPHSHEADHRQVEIHAGLLDKNARLAERNRGFFRAKRLLVLNVLASPGAGKTAFIERMAADLRGRVRLGVIVGDLATDNDAQRLRQVGVPAVQVTTGTTCHLDAAMVAAAMERLDLDALDLLVIENVGNLVCPATYDLGEDLRTVLLSVTEGEDKPLKYPIMFQSADTVVVSKTDLAAATGFDREAALASIRRVAPRAPIHEVSSRTGHGMEPWYAHLGTLLAAKRR